MKRHLLSLAACLMTLVLLGASSLHTAWAEAPQAGSSAAASGANKKNTVKLIVNYGDGVEKHFSRIPWRDKMTVQDVVTAATKHPRGIAVKQRGKKTTAFLSQIDDLANQPRGRSWVYRVNGKLADRSFGIFPVAAGDVVDWSFREYPLREGR